MLKLKTFSRCLLGCVRREKNAGFLDIGFILKLMMLVQGKRDERYCTMCTGSPCFIFLVLKE